jgi:hypothetical protein
MAMFAVVMLGSAMVLMSSVVVARGVAQYGNTHGDALWEQALATAESGLSVGLATIEADGSYHTGEVAIEGLAGTDQEKAWVVAIADARPEEDLVSTSDGEFVIVKASNSAFLYSAGFAPSRDSENRRVRVVRIDYALIPYATTWFNNFAFLSGDDLELRGNPTFLTGHAVGIHANAFLDVGGSTFVEGCLSASGGANVTGAVSQDPECPAPGAQPLEFIPLVQPRDHWEDSFYDLCPDGKVRAGPAHPISGNTAANVPCTGQTLTTDASSSPYLGWRFMGCCDSADWATWKYESTGSNDGVFYVFEGNAIIVSSPGSTLIPWQTTVIAEARGVCGSLQGGDIDIAGSPEVIPFPGAGNLQFVAGRDIDISGNPGMSGLTAAHEQIDISGTAVVVGGGYLAESGCDSGDLVTTSRVGGNATVDNDGPVETELGTTIDLLTVTSWVEI